MKQAANMPRVAFVVNLAAADRDEAKTARVHHLVHLFSGHRLPATWAVDSAERASLLKKQNSVPAKTEVALKVDQQWLSPLSSHKQFRTELNSRIVGLAAASGTAPHLVLGDLQLLRSRAAILAEQGISGIFSERPDRSSLAMPRPLPCGLWHLAPSFSIPRRLRLLNLLGRRRLSAKHLLAAGEAKTTLVIVQAAELGHAGARGLRGIEKLLREISWAASRDQLIVSTVGELLAELASQRVVKPQKSILRAAA